MTASVLKLSYPMASAVVAENAASQINLALETGRSEVGLTGRVRDAELFRDALLTACAVMRSDLRYKGKDRTAYLAHLIKQGKRATAAIWEAQKSFLEGAYADDTPRPRGLDPVFTVDPDEASVEVFSRDESAYARLAFGNELFDQRGAAHGTTLADLSDGFIDQVDRIRTYQPLELSAVSKDAPSRVAREIDVPNEWLRGFLQVQSAATLPNVSASFLPVDLYNVLFALKTHRAKKAPRGLRFELVPGARARIVIEPWELVFESHAEIYRGSAPRVVRIFGRQRLLSLAQALPHLKALRVHLLGAGLPSFWVLDMGLARLTVALTNWSESKWASATSFDALMPKDTDGDKAAKTAAESLRKHGPLPLAEIAKLSHATPAATRKSLQRACLEGRVLYDIDRAVYRPRLLLAEPIDESRIRYGSTREAAAHRLLGDQASPDRGHRHHQGAHPGRRGSGDLGRCHRQASASHVLPALHGRPRRAGQGRMVQLSDVPAFCASRRAVRAHDRALRHPQARPRRERAAPWHPRRPQGHSRGDANLRSSRWRRRPSLRQALAR